VTGEVIFGGRDLTIEEVHALATRKAEARLSGDPGFREGIVRSAAHVAETLARDGVIYGVTTGYGDSVTTPVPLDLVPELPLHLTRFPGVGTGRILTPEETRAVMAARLASLVRGWSGASGWARMPRLP